MALKKDSWVFHEYFMGFFMKLKLVVSRPIPIVLVKCWKVAHWNAKKLLKNCQKSKKLLPNFQKLLPKFLAIFMLTEKFTRPRCVKAKCINSLIFNIF